MATAHNKASRENANNPQSEAKLALPSRIGVGVIVFREDGAVLMGQRKGSHGANTWAFPGGHPDDGESHMDCAIRETFEETGLTLTHLCLGPKTCDTMDDIGVEYTTHFVLAKHTSGSPIVKEPHKCQQWRWVRWNDLVITFGESLFKPVKSLLARHADGSWLASQFYQRLLQQSSCQLVSFDLDGTLVRNTSTTLYYADLLGVSAQVQALEEEFSHQRINSTQFMQRISSIFHRLTVDFIRRHVDGMPFIRHIAETVAHLKQQGITTLIVTTANQQFAQAVADKFGFDQAYGTQFEIHTDGRIGSGIKVCSSDDKITHVRNAARRLSIGMQSVVAVGDSLTDIPLFSTVGRSIALNPDEHLRGRADRIVQSESLLDILHHFDLLASKKTTST